MVKITGLCAVSFLFTPIIYAQSEAPTYNDEKVMVITGTKTLKGLKDGPVRTEVITDKEIKEQRYRDAAEAILDIPGVTLVNQTAKIGKAAVIQGLGGDRVLVLIDGVPAIENSFSGYDLSQISTADIKQIEVVKGGASALYGGQAMGGVINIITKKATGKFNYTFDILRDQHTEKSPSYDTGYNSLKAVVSGIVSNTTYKATITHNKNASIDKDESTISKDSPDFEKFVGSLYVEQKLSEKHSVYADFKHYSEDSRTYVAKIPQGGTEYVPVHNDGDISGNRLRAGYKFTASPDFKLHLYGLKEKIKDSLALGDDPTTPYRESVKNADFVNDRIELQSDFNFLENHVGTVGVVYNSSRLDQKNENRVNATTVVETTDIDDKHSNNLEAYVQDDWIFDNHEIVTGVRYTHDKYFGDNFAPKLNYSYLPNWFDSVTTNIRASFGTGYRIPNLKERFYILDHRAMGYIVFGNPDLEPEESRSYQLGIEFAKTRTFSFGVNAFFNNVKKMIDSSNADDSTDQEMRITYKNINRVKIRGLEQTASVTLWDNLTIGQSFTYTRVEDKGTDLIVPNRPFYIGQMNVSYTLLDNKLRFLYNFRYFGDSYANSANTEKYSRYTESDFRINYRVVKNTDVYLGMKNIFNATRAPQRDDASSAYGDGLDQRPIFGRVLFFGFSIEG
jgi:outer membrane receptor for ferrienterochelin and colicins